MRAFKASFPRLKDRFRYENTGERKLMLRLLILLHNVRARKVGINQIKNVYQKALDVDVNRYYLG
jgi:hypothetical protein